MAEHLDDCSVMEQSSSSCSPLQPTLSPSNQPEFWNRMEEATREIIEHVYPTLVSEDQRRDVIEYMQRFIQRTLGFQVYSFGSVPLKTYLPDGDIDLTTFGGPWSDEELARKVFSVLKREKQNVDAEFIIKDVKLIPAKVKLVRCLVQNIVVDISFNQLGGICTLCFFEKMDELIGKDHLFKRSIILIKAWCYYESHILGAVRGLISTYALETLVLYIFHLFHSSLNGPLAVLYKFLDYFSKFDWDKYCISLSGPVRISTLPEFVVETPENGGQDLLLTGEFLNECLEMYTVPSRGFETNQRVFRSKYLNVVDPLKENNNLGRSVNKANFYRVRTAFTYGARKLGQIMLQSEQDISPELRNFFSNMLRRHGSGQGRNVLDAVPLERYNAISPASASNHLQEGQLVNKSKSSSSASAAGNDLSESSGETVPSVSKERFAGEAKEFDTIGSVRIQEKMHIGVPTFLSDLTGDIDSHLNSLRYGRWWLDYVQNGLMSPLFYQLQIKNSWEVFPPALLFNQNAPDLINANGAHVFYMNPPMIPNANFVMEEFPNPRGTGKYFPIANHHRDGPFFARRNSHRNNGRRMAYLPSERNFFDGNTRERPHHFHYYYPNQTNGYCDMSQAGILGSLSGGINGSINHPYEKAPEFRSMEPLPAEVRYPPEDTRQEDRVTSRQSYQLTDEKDFPPL